MRWLTLLLLQGFFVVLCYWLAAFAVGFCLKRILFPHFPGGWELPAATQRALAFHSYFARTLSIGVLLGVAVVEAGWLWIATAKGVTSRIYRCALYSTAVWGGFLTYLLVTACSMLLVFVPVEPIPENRIRSNLLGTMPSEWDFPLLVLAGIALAGFGMHLHAILKKGGNGREQGPPRT